MFKTHLPPLLQHLPLAGQGQDADKLDEEESLYDAAHIGTPMTPDLAINVADDWNNTYYGRTVTPVDIIITAKARNPQADRFVQDLNQASSRPKTSSLQ